MSDENLAQQFHIPIVTFLNTVVRRIAEATAWLNVALLGVILTQVVLRYGFNRGLVPLEELMWYLYSVVFMFGLGYAVTTDSHVRVDIMHMAFSRRTQHVIEILGILLLLMPVLWILFDHSLDWALESYRIDESSQNPTGLPHRWIIKAVIPLSMVLLFIATLARLIQEVSLLWHHDKELPEALPGRVSMLHHLFVPHTVQEGKDKGEGC
jgi:TRAP-type mannitol/chloroaromatic compound transport system permease small subunit